MSDLDDELNRTLREHADGVQGAPLAFDDVRGRATSIRRRRRLASGLGVAAAIAVIVPTAMFATHGQRLLAAAGHGTADGHGHEHPVPDVHADDGLRPARDSTSATCRPGHRPPSRWSPMVTTRPPRPARPSCAGRPRESSSRRAARRSARTRARQGLARNAAGTAVAWATDEGDVMVWADG